MKILILGVLAQKMWVFFSERIWYFSSILLRFLAKKSQYGLLSNVANI